MTDRVIKHPNGQITYERVIKMYSPESAAAMLGLEEADVMALIKRKELKAYNVGTERFPRYFVMSDELRKYKEKQ